MNFDEMKQKEMYRVLQQRVDNKYVFFYTDDECIEVVNPFLDHTGTINVDPIEEYGYAKILEAYNKLTRDKRDH